ncbi:ParA family protein [Lichenihabitans psoromatis]|uniref:ParA family protein n=1 Tax=Lichenihabitans psoromatis TaxID=2528642 RepID=UPI001036561D|nr:AAA family ATPase [Lichenihabitans psoromatis]
MADVHNPKTIRSFLQGYLQNTGPGPITTFKGPHTHENVKIVAGDFWLNVYSDALSVGNDLLTGTGISKFVSLRTLERKLAADGQHFDYVMIDLPPSFGGLVRSALYSSDYLVIPCTSDTFSEYCISLIEQMLPQFVSDWGIGITRFKQMNFGSQDFDSYGKPVYAGWIFNGFDTRAGKELRADAAHHTNIQSANQKLADSLATNITGYSAILPGSKIYLGGIEDMNVLIQNSLWQNIPVSNLERYGQVKDLSGDRAKWSEAQLILIRKVKDQISAISGRIINDL